MWGRSFGNAKLLFLYPFSDYTFAVSLLHPDQYYLFLIPIAGISLGVWLWQRTQK